MSKKLRKVWIDMDGVAADLIKAVHNHPDYRPGIALDELDVFEHLEPIEGAIESINKIIDSGRFDVHILSTPPWDNVEAWMHKRIWIEKYLPRLKKKITLTHHKHHACTSPDDIIIDDRLKNGVEHWDGIHLHFGTESCKTWVNVLEYLNI